MAQLLLQNALGERSYLLTKRLVTAGGDVTHDIPVVGKGQQLAFTIAEKDGAYELSPGEGKLRVNGEAIHRPWRLRSCDRIEWLENTLVYVGSEKILPGGASVSTQLRSLEVLQNLASTLGQPGALQLALHQVLDHLVETSGAEVGYLLNDWKLKGEWELLAARQSIHTDRPTRKGLFSNTILKEALERRRPVYVESVVGHPWGEAVSVMAAQIYSVACFPLFVGERALGAAFLFTQTPGKTLKREALDELGLLATQATLMLATEARWQETRDENSELKKLVPHIPSKIVWGASPSMQDVSRKIEKLAPTPLSVLVLGETGTGKELVARELHARSLRAKGPFVPVNCAAIPETLLESTLFGHEKGAFTGAVRSQKGKFTLANDGTLFLDEIGDLPLDLQAKLLRVLQERVVEPVGAAKAHAIDVRLLAATHHDLEKKVREGSFRQDLYFRLNGALLRLPALRERREDIVPLAQHFLAQNGHSHTFSATAQQRLTAHDWPGNVRELEQVIARASFLCEGKEIREEDLELGQSSLPAESVSPLHWTSLKDAQKAFTGDFIAKILARNKGNRAATARELDISERSLYRLMADENGKYA